MLKKRKTEKSLLQAGAGAGTQDVKEEDIVNESNPTTFSTPSEETRIAMIEFVKERVGVSATYDVDFINLAEEHKLGIDEVLSGKLDFAQAYSRYDMRRDQKLVHAKYDVYASNGTKNVANVLRYIMKPGAHRHAL